MGKASHRENKITSFKSITSENFQPIHNLPHLNDANYLHWLVEYIFNKDTKL